MSNLEYARGEASRNMGPGLLLCAQNNLRPLATLICYFHPLLSSDSGRRPMLLVHNCPSATRRPPGKLRAAVESVGLQWTGRQHAGIDDATNAARLAIALVRQGAVMRPTDWFEGHGPGGGAGPTPAAAAAASPPQPRQTKLVLVPPASPSVCSEPHAAASTSAAAQALSAASPLAGGGVAAASGGGSPGGSAGGGNPAASVDFASWNGLCACQPPTKAALRTTKKPGPNHGRRFYSCGRWTTTNASRQCGWFMWAPASTARGGGGRGGGGKGGPASGDS